MFSKLILFAAFVVPLVSALILHAPENPISGTLITIKWDSEEGDPATWSFYLINDAFNDNFGIANNVDPAPGQLSLTLPVVPDRGVTYTLRAVNLGDVNQVYATSPAFAIRTTSSSSTLRTATSSLSSVSPRSTSTTSTTSRSSSLTFKTSSTLDTSSSSTTGASAPTQIAPSAASRQIDFKIGSMVAAVLAIGAATILTL